MCVSYCAFSVCVYVFVYVCVCQKTIFGNIIQIFIIFNLFLNSASPSVCDQLCVFLFTYHAKMVQPICWWIADLPLECGRSISGNTLSESWLPLLAATSWLYLLSYEWTAGPLQASFLEFHLTWGCIELGGAWFYNLLWVRVCSWFTFPKRYYFLQLSTTPLLSYSFYPSFAMIPDHCNGNVQCICCIKVWVCLWEKVSCPDTYQVRYTDCSINPQKCAQFYLHNMDLQVSAMPETV